MTERPVSSFNVWSFNARKQRDTMAEFLRDPRVYNSQIIAIQEPFVNSLMAGTHNPCSDRFNVLWPTNVIYSTIDDCPIRVCFLISKAIPPECIQTTTHSGTLQTVQLQFTHEGNPRAMAIHNCYLAADGANRTVTRAEQTLDLLETALATNQDYHQVVTGDFNAQHPRWETLSTRKAHASLSCR